MEEKKFFKTELVLSIMTGVDIDHEQLFEFREFMGRSVEEPRTSNRVDAVIQRRIITAYPEYFGDPRWDVAVRKLKQRMTAFDLLGLWSKKSGWIEGWVAGLGLPEQLEF